MAYELLAGAPPFEGDTFSDVTLGHLRTPPGLSRLPPEARSTVSWLLAKDPKSRPQHAAELLAVLEGKASVTVVPSGAEVVAAAGAASAGNERETQALPRGLVAIEETRPRDHRRRRARVALALMAVVVSLAGYVQMLRGAVLQLGRQLCLDQLGLRDQ